MKDFYILKKISIFIFLAVFVLTMLYGQSDSGKTMREKAVTYKGSMTPPTNLHKEPDGHWTPYTPPTPPEGASFYVVVKGDTLWDISTKQLGSPYLWPQIWDANTYITDAHWIYPGDPLNIKKPEVIENPQAHGGTTAKLPEITPSTSGGMEPASASEKQTTLSTQVEKSELKMASDKPPVYERDIYCTGYIDPDFKKTSLQIMASTDSRREDLGDKMVVYLNEGRQQKIGEGEIYTIIRPVNPVYHPVSGGAIGTFVLMVGRLKVLTVMEKTSLAEIIMACDAVHYGDGLIPFEAITFPWDVKANYDLPVVLESSTFKKPMGKVVWSQDRLEDIGDGNVVYVDIGSKDHLLPGDKIYFIRNAGKSDTLVTTVDDLYREQKVDVPWSDLYRENKPKITIKDKRSNRFAKKQNAKAARRSKALETKGLEGLNTCLGEGVILSTQKDTATVKILVSLNDIHVGDNVLVE